MNYAYEDDTLPPWLPGPVKRFIEAARRLGRSNKMLKSFERGFISEGGIKDREWYKHLGVAPGKWLGKLPFFFLSPEMILKKYMHRLWRNNVPCTNGSYHV